MPLVTYAQARPWAKAIREAVKLRKMPPWFADPRFGKFANDPSLTPAELATIDAWVMAGAPEGPASDAPPPLSWPTGWSIGEPDLVLSMPEAVPGSRAFGSRLSVPHPADALRHRPLGRGRRGPPDRSQRRSSCSALCARARRPVAPRLPTRCHVRSSRAVCEARRAPAKPPATSWRSTARAQDPTRARPAWHGRYRPVPISSSRSTTPRSRPMRATRCASGFRSRRSRPRNAS